MMALLNRSCPVCAMIPNEEPWIMSFSYFLQIGWEIIATLWNALLHLAEKLINANLNEIKNEVDSEDIIKRIVKDGKEISSSYSTKNGGPVMLPPVLENRQEGEARVYKALENLKYNCIAIHRLRFTHYQYIFFVGYDCFRKDQSEEGEIDFLIIHDESISVLHVISSNCDNNERFSKYYAAIKDSREKVYKLVTGINRKLKFIEAPNIQQFVVFTNINRNFAEKSLVGYVSLCHEEKLSILFENDLENQEVLLCRLLGKPTLRIRMMIENSMKWFLLGLWNTNKNIDSYAATKSGDFSKNIERFDDIKGPSCRIKGVPAKFSDNSTKPEQEQILLMKKKHTKFEDKKVNSLIKEDPFNEVCIEDLIKRIVKAGAESLSLHCKKNNGHPIMLPPVPFCKFIDKYPDQTGKDPNWVTQIEKQQREYEAEVKVYRALEDITIREDIIVLHGLNFTHQQYNLFVRHECTKKNTDEEGEIDFLVIHDKFVAIIEVKASACDNEEKFKRNYKKSKHQLEKCWKLLMGASKQFGFTKSQAIYQFTVFTSINRKCAEDSLIGYGSLSTKEKDCIVFKDDLENQVALLSSLFKELFSRKNTENKMKCFLLGLWCMEKNNDFNVTRTCDFSKNIERVDELLRTSEITSVLKRGNRSPLVKNAPSIFKEHLNIKFLTASQLAVFESKQNKLCIRGPAGTGKTILIMAKVIETVKSTNKDVAIIVLKKILAKNTQKFLNNRA